jgi:UDP-glucose 4-epimerase
MGDINLNGLKVLVTGGSGYLGAQLVAALKKEGAEVFVVDKEATPSDHVYNLDITDREAVDKAIREIQPEIIFHLAASLNRERNFDHFDRINQINHDGTLNLLLALKDIPYRNFIFTSTSEVYGSNPAPFHEEQIPKPASPYSLTKLYAEELIGTFSNLYNKHFTVLRLFNFFGKDMPENFFIPQMIQAFQNKAVFEMTEGEQKRDFLYVEDVIQALLLSARSEKALNETFNVCSGQAVSLKQLATEIKQTMKSDCEIRFGALPYRENEVWNMVGDNTKIKKALGFKIGYSLSEAIEQLINK